MVVKLPKASILTNAKVSPSLFLSTSQSQLYFYKLLVPGTKNNSFTLLTLQQGGARSPLSQTQAYLVVTASAP